MSRGSTQRITAADRKAGRIRIPIGATKRLFPPHRTDLKINLRGQDIVVRWDPRLGPDRERSGTLGVGVDALTRLTTTDEVLGVSKDSTGSIAIG